MSHFAHAVFLLDKAVIGWNRGSLSLTGNTQVSAYKSGCWLQFKGGIMFPHMAFIVILSLLLCGLIEWFCVLLNSLSRKISLGDQKD